MDASDGQSFTRADRGAVLSQAIQSLGIYVESEQPEMSIRKPTFDVGPGTSNTLLVFGLGNCHAKRLHPDQRPAIWQTILSNFRERGEITNFAASPG